MKAMRELIGWWSYGDVTDDGKSANGGGKREGA